VIEHTFDCRDLIGRNGAAGFSRESTATPWLHCRTVTYTPLSSRGLGRRILSPETRVRIPVAVPRGLQGLFVGAALLLPQEPRRDLLDLITSQGITVVWPDDHGFIETSVSATPRLELALASLRTRGFSFRAVRPAGNCPEFVPRSDFEVDGIGCRKRSLDVLLKPIGTGAARRHIS
jgi:hypothetical protein